MADAGHRRTGSPDAEDMTFEAVDLCRAERARDLWTAIEAAQCSRVVTHDPLDGAEEEKALDVLGDALDRVVEAWDDEGLQNKAPLLGILDHGLAAIAPHGLSLYWGCVERQLMMTDGEVMPMRVAVLAISRSSAPTQRVAVAHVLDGDDVEDNPDDEQIRS